MGIFFQNLIEYFSIEKYEELCDGVLKLYVQKNKLREIVSHLKNQPEFSFDILQSITCMDDKNILELSYILYSTQTNKTVVISTSLGRDDASIETLSNVFSSADWDEREIYDLFGITFTSHPNLKRLLMPIDWIGHPLRKDYVLDDERLAWNK